MVKIQFEEMSFLSYPKGQSRLKGWEDQQDVGEAENPWLKELN